jgi:hypothetical protein
MYLKRRTIRSAVLMSTLIALSACTSVQVWQLNDSIPHRLDQAERERFDNRIESFLRIHDVNGAPSGWYVVNGDKMLIKVPYGLSEEFSSRVPYIACNPDGDEAKCFRIE